MSGLNSEGFDPVQEAPVEDNAEDFGGLPIGDSVGFDDELPSEEQQALEQSVYSVRDVNPDEHAAVVGLARKAGLPVDTVARNRKEVETDIQLNGLKKLADASPNLATWASDPNNAAVAKDDFPGLQQIESLFKELAQLDFIGMEASKSVQKYSQIDGFERGMEKITGTAKSLGSSLVSGAGSMLSNVAKLPNIAGAATYAPYNIAQELMGSPENQVKYPETNPVAEYYARGAKAYAVPEMSTSIITEIEKGNYRRAGMAAATQLLANAPNQAALLISAIAGFPAVGLLAAGATTAADTYQEGIEKGARPAAATVNAFGAGVAESAFESLGGAIPVLKHWESIIAKRYGKDVSWQVMKDFAKSLAHSFFSEGSEEFGTQLAQDFSSYITGVDKNALQGTLRRGVDAGIIGGLSGATMTAPTAVAMGIARNEDIARSRRDKQAFLEASKAIEQSKTFNRDKQIAADFIEKATEGTKYAELHIDPQGAETYYQSRNMSAAAEFQGMGISPQQFIAAKEAGTLIKIPARVWAEKIVGTEHVAGLADHVTFDENGKTPTQAKEQQEALGDAASQVINEAKLKQDSFERVSAMRKDVESRITAQLKSVKPENMDQKTWEQNAAVTARLWAAMISVQAEQRGLTADQVMAQMPTKLDVGGKMVDLTPIAQAAPKVSPVQVTDEQWLMQTSKLPDLGVPHEYFVAPEGRGNITLPGLKPSILAAINTNDKPVVVKESIAIKNRKHHPEIGVGEDAQILRETLYDADYIFQSKPKTKPNYWSFAKQDGGDSVTIIEINEKKGAHEVVSWFRLKKKEFERQQKRTRDEGGHFLITKELSLQGAAGLSALTPGESNVSQENRGGNAGQYGDTFEQTRQVEFGDLSPLGFYSQVEREVQNMDFKAMPAKDLAGRIKNIQGIKQEELETIGLQDWLNAREDKVSKEEVLEFIKNNGVKVDQIVLAESIGTSSVAGLQWSNPEHIGYEGGDDTLYEEMKHYRDESEWGQERRKELEDELRSRHTDENGIVDEESLKNEVEIDLESEAYERAEESLNSPDSYYAENEVTESTTGWTLRGNDERGWYNPDTGEFFEDDLEEAKIKLAALMIERGEIEGDTTELIREEDIKWRGIIGKTPSRDTLKKKIKVLIKTDFDRLDKKAREKYPQDYEDKTEQELKETVQNNVEYEASQEIEASYEDPSNKRNTITIGIDHPILKGTIQGNNVKGYTLTVYGEKKKTRDGGAARTVKEFKLESKSVDDAKTEAVRVLVEKKFATAKPVFDSDSNTINEPSGPAKWSRYKVPGGTNYREVLLTLPNIGTESFSYRTHFDQKNILAHVRITDRMDAEGRKTLFVEELQSDWHQQGREKGYKSEGKKKSLPDGYSKEYVNGKDGMYHLVDSNGEPLRVSGASVRGINDEDLLRHYNELLESTQVPDAPFKNTESWATLAMKRIVRMAVEQGYEAVAWSPGSVHVDRWGTDSISWVKKVSDEGTYWLVGSVEQVGGNADGVNIEEMARERGKLLERRGEKVTSKEELKDVIADTLGRERTDRSLDALTESTWKQMQSNDSGVKAPRKEGMEFFYDNMLPKKVFPTILKKLDKSAKVTTTEIDTIETGRTADGEKEKLKAWEIPLTDILKAKVLEGQPLFQADKNRVQGATVFFPDFAVIKLLNADQSTLIHESAHVWLNYLFETRDQGTTDWARLADWLKIDDGQKKLTKEQHEAFARGFERYLFEGHAPNSYVRSAFRRMAKWLIKIYKNLFELNRQAGFEVTLSDDARAIFDRLLSTEEEIAQAEADINATTGNVDVESLAPVVRKKLESLREKAHGQAFDQLVKAQMLELTKEHKAEIAAAREKREPELRKQVEAQPIYVAIAQMRDTFGKDAKQVSQDFLVGKMSEDDKIALEMFAEFAGFSSADHLANVVIKTESIDYAVKQALDAEMKPDIKDTDEIRLMAEDAVHNLKRLELLALEAEILGRRIEKAATDEANKAMIRNAARPDEIMATVRERLGAMSVKEASSFRRYYTAERNAAVKVAKALKDKDFPRAARAKRQQMLAHAMAIESQKIKRQADKNLRYLEKSRQLDREKLGRAEHFEQFAKLLNRFGFERSDFDESRPRASLSQWVDAVTEETNTANIAEWLYDETYQKSPNELTPQELQDLRDAVQNIRFVASMEGRAYGLADKVDIETQVRELIEASTVAVPNKDRVKNTLEPGTLDRPKQLAAKYQFSLTKMQTLLRKLDSFKDFGVWFNTFHKRVYESANIESRLFEEYVPKIKAMWSEYSKKELADMANNKIAIPEWGNASVTKIRLMAMARNLGNTGNRQRLFENVPIGEIPRDSWNEASVMAVLSRELDARDWRAVQASWDVINSLWPKVAELHKELTGFEPEKVEALPFTIVTRNGEVVKMAGGYYPLKEDPRGSGRAIVQAETETPLYEANNPSWRAATRTGHTKERVRGARYPVTLDIGLMDQHMVNVIHDIAFRKTIIDLNRIIARPEIIEELKSTLGIPGYLTIKEWVASVASGEISNAAKKGVAGIEDVIRIVRQNTTTAGLLWRIGPILQNFANPILYSGAIESFGKASVLRGIIFRGILDYIPKAFFSWRQAQEVRDFVASKSSFMRDKFVTPDFSLAEARIEAFGGKSWPTLVKEFGSAALAWTDNITAIPMWLQAYNEEFERNGGDDKGAVLYADTLIDRVLGSGRKYDVAAIQRGTELEKSFAMFGSFLNTELNRWMAEVGAARIGTKEKTQLLGFMAARLLLFVPISALLAGKGPDEDEPLEVWLAGEMANSVWGFFPAAREFLTFATNSALGIKTYGYRPSPLYGGAEAVFRLSKATSWEDAAEGVSKVAAYAVPFPDQWNAWAWNGYDMIVNGQEFRTEDIWRRRRRSERGQ
jgi:hypothetical protein